MFSAMHSQETTRYTILFFGSPAQGDGSSVKKLCKVGGLQASLKKQQKHLKAGLKAGLEAVNIQNEAGREAGLEAGEAGVEASLEASRHEASASVQGSKALRQASVASLGHGLQAEQRRTNEARHKRPLANKNDSCEI